MMQFFEVDTNEASGLFSKIVLMLFCCLNSVGSYASNFQTIQQFEMKSCNVQDCYYLKTKKARSGFLQSSLFVFDGAKLIVSDKNGAQFSEFNASEGYYDMDLNRIILRGVEGEEFNELALSLNTGTFSYFKVDAQ